MLVVGNFLSGHGRARGVCEDLAERLTAAGWAVIETSRKSGRLARLLDMAWTVWSKRHEYAVAQVDLYSGPAFSWAEVACWELRRLGKPYCLTLHGGNLPAFSRRWPRRVRSVLQRAAIVTSPSEYLRDAVKSFRTDIRVVPNPLEVSRYPYRLRGVARPRLVWLRSFHEIYNPRLAVRALAILSREFPDVTLTMIGPDKGDGTLLRTRQEVEDLGVSRRVRFLGSIPKPMVPSALGEADIFLNTTDVDNTPVSVLEAMACGLCVVSTNVGGLPHLIDDGRDGLLVPRDDAAAMARAVRRVLLEPLLASALSANGRRKAERSDWSVVLPTWESMLGAVAEGVA